MIGGKSSKSLSRSSTAEGFSILAKSLILKRFVRAWDSQAVVGGTPLNPKPIKGVQSSEMFGLLLMLLQGGAFMSILDFMIVDWDLLEELTPHLAPQPKHGP